MNIYSKDKTNHLCFSTALFQHCMSNALNDPYLKVLSAELDSSAYDTETAKAKYNEEQKKFTSQFSKCSESQIFNFHIKSNLRTHFFVVPDQPVTKL